MASGKVVAKIGRRNTLRLSIAFSAVGLALTLAGNLIVIVIGLLIFTAGFFAAHAVASGWVPVLASEARAQASSLYNLLYYVGSSVLGWLIGIPFMHYGWDSVVLCVVVLQAVAMILASFLSKRDPSLGKA